MSGAVRRATSHHRAGSWPSAEVLDVATLDYDRRHRRRLRIVTDSGAPLMLDLPKAVVLEEGDGLALETGGWVGVRAASESLLEVTADDPHHLLRLAWHVGNRHIPAEIRAGALRIRPDHVIAEMIVGLGGVVRAIEAPFQPESGAYSGGHAPGHGHGHGH